jgi:hypothetical protein
MGLTCVKTERTSPLSWSPSFASISALAPSPLFPSYPPDFFYFMLYLWNIQLFTHMIPNYLIPIPIALTYIIVYIVTPYLLFSLYCKCQGYFGLKLKLSFSYFSKKFAKIMYERLQKEGTSSRKPEKYLYSLLLIGFHCCC